MEGESIRIHPLVFNRVKRTFDGDQMAVACAVVGSFEAQMEARMLMMAPNNYSARRRQTIITPTQAATRGCYYVTAEPRPACQEPRPPETLVQGEEVFCLR